MLLEQQEGGLRDPGEKASWNGPRVLIACKVMEPELESLREMIQGVQVRYVEQALHRVPQNMASRVQQEIDRVSSYAGLVILGYGLCSNGIVGVVAPPQGLVVPKAHDCIALFLGSLENYRRSFGERPGTYYLTPGWVAEHKDPLGILQEYIQRYGEETAQWVMTEELKHYTHIALINSGVGDVKRLRERARENARYFGKQYHEIAGDLSYLRRLLQGPYTDEDFFFIAPGEKVTQERYLQEALACASS
ncbi:MAG: DUF1638 domain-containing protein [bacterium]